jgi:hypothetical protein
MIPHISSVQITALRSRGHIPKIRASFPMITYFRNGPLLGHKPGIKHTNRKFSLFIFFRKIIFGGCKTTTKKGKLDISKCKTPTSAGI